MELMTAYTEQMLEDDQDILQHLFEQKMDLKPDVARRLFGTASGFNLSMAIRCLEESFTRRCYATKLIHNRTPIYAAGFDPEWGNLHQQRLSNVDETIDIELVFDKLEDAQFVSRCNKIVELMSESFYMTGYITESKVYAGHPIINLHLLVQNAQWKV